MDWSCDAGFKYWYGKGLEIITLIKAKSAIPFRIALFEYALRLSRRYLFTAFLYSFESCNS